MPTSSPFFLSRVVALLVCVVSFGLPEVTQADPWQVALTQKQQKALDETMGQQKPLAFAISPDGRWGRAWGVRSNDDAVALALHFCRFYLRPGNRDCVPYMLNGKVIAPAVVSAPKVKQIYKPVNGRKAAAFFGLANVNFAGDREAAMRQFHALKADPQTKARLRHDPGFAALLSQYSLTLTGNGGFALGLGVGRAEQHTSAKSGILEIRYTDWIATREGLLCMFGGRYASTGKHIGTNCMVIDQIAAGKVQFSWGGSLNVRRKGQMVAGDATRSAVR